MTKQNDRSIGIKLELVNFNMYLNRTMQSEALQRWVLLNQCFKECHPKHLNLLECKPNDLIYNKVRSIVGFQNIEIDQATLNRVFDLKGQFILHQQVSDAQCYVMHMFLSMAEQL